MPNDRIRDLPIERELSESYLTYAMSTIMDRALPDVRDGLKPSQRRILIAMHDLKLTPGRKALKCAKICGNTSGDYHPHGEAVIYPTLVRMAQDWSMRHPLIDGQGNFGSADGDPPAAMRYTEARMDNVMVDMMADIDMETVDSQPNYDNRLQEYTVLPARFPNLLVNGSTGIAVGMACNFVPHNLNEICDAVVHVINHPDCTLADLVKIVPGPDFPTGGIVRGIDGIMEGYATGRGKLSLESRIEIETDKKGRSQLILTEIPYGVIRKNIIEGIVEAVKDGRMPDVSDANDHSGRLYKCRIVVDLKRDADPEVVKNQLLQFTQARVTVSIINIALVNRQPRTMGLKELIEHFITHRKEVITRRTKYLLRKAQQRAHILEGNILAVCDIDEVVKLIRSSKTREEAISKLRAKAFRIAPDHPSAPLIPENLLKRAGVPGGMSLTQVQAEAIGRLQLIQLVGLEIERLTKEYTEVMGEIAEYEAILGDEALVLDIIREDTLELKEKHGNPRRTTIDPTSAGAFNLDALITPHDVVVTVSHKGYVKRIPADTYRSQGRGGRGIKGTESREGDYVEHLFVANTHDHLLFFTNSGRVYARRVYDIPEGTRTSMGRAVANLLDLQDGEKIAQVLTITDFNKDEAYLMFGTRSGTVKKTPLSAYSKILRNGIIAIGLEEGDSLIDVAVTTGKDHVILATKSGLAVRFEEEEVRSMGRPAGGVTGVRFKRDGDQVVAMAIVHSGQNENLKLLTACANGFGKRTPLEDYPVKGRGTQGVISIDANDRNGEVVSSRIVTDTDELMMITEKGILIRTKVNEIRETGRSASGVRLIKVDDGDKLVAMTPLAGDPDEPEVTEEPSVESGE
jgi:DNA gyrase subunit A